MWRDGTPGDLVFYTRTGYLQTKIEATSAETGGNGLRQPFGSGGAENRQESAGERRLPFTGPRRWRKKIYARMFYGVQC